MDPNDWIIDDHAHPAFGKSAYQFPSTEARQPWVTDGGKCLLCGKTAQANHCASDRHAKKLTECYDPMQTLFKLEHKNIIDSMSQQDQKKFKTKFIQGLMDRGWSHQDILDHQTRPNELRDYLVMSSDASTEAGSAAGDSIAHGDSEAENPAKRHCESGPGPRRPFESGPGRQFESGPCHWNLRLWSTFKHVERWSLLPIAGR